MINLKGMAWNHSRGFTSVVATAQRFEELNPGIRITWEKRSLQAFADASLEELTKQYDLLVMDHPHVALAAEDQLLLPYNDYLTEDFLADQARNSVGKSHPSYQFYGKQWTLAIDAATPIATWRADLMERHGIDVPSTWDELLALAANGHVGLAAIPIDLLMHLYAISSALDAQLFESKETLANHDAMAQGLESLKELVSLCPAECQEMNPIQIAERMTRTDEIAYCPLGYGYSNYSRPGYADNKLAAGDIVSYRGRPLCSALGGAGLAVSSKTNHAAACMTYAEFTASPAIQRGIFLEAGGQPGHRSVWIDEGINARNNQFFKNTLPTLDRAITRPQYHGYMYFQDHGSPVVHDGVTGKVSITETLEKLNAIYRESYNH